MFWRYLFAGIKAIRPRCINGNIYNYKRELYHGDCLKKNSVVVPSFYVSIFFLISVQI